MPLDDPNFNIEPTTDPSPTNEPAAQAPAGSVNSSSKNFDGTISARKTALKVFHFALHGAGSGSVQKGLESFPWGKAEQQGESEKFLTGIVAGMAAIQKAVVEGGVKDAELRQIFEGPLGKADLSLKDRSRNVLDHFVLLANKRGERHFAEELLEAREVIDREPELLRSVEQNVTNEMKVAMRDVHEEKLPEEKTVVAAPIIKETPKQVKTEEKKVEEDLDDGDEDEVAPIPQEPQPLPTPEVVATPTNSAGPAESKPEVVSDPPQPPPIPQAGPGSGKSKAERKAQQQKQDNVKAKAEKKARQEAGKAQRASSQQSGTAEADVTVTGPSPSSQQQADVVGVIPAIEPESSNKNLDVLTSRRGTTPGTTDEKAKVGVEFTVEEKIAVPPEGSPLNRGEPSGAGEQPIAPLPASPSVQPKPTAAPTLDVTAKVSPTAPASQGPKPGLVPPVSQKPVPPHTQTPSKIVSRGPLDTVPTAKPLVGNGKVDGVTRPQAPIPSPLIPSGRVPETSAVGLEQGGVGGISSSGQSLSGPTADYSELHAGPEQPFRSPGTPLRTGPISDIRPVTLRIPGTQAEPVNRDAAQENYSESGVGGYQGDNMLDASGMSVADMTPTEFPIGSMDNGSIETEIEDVNPSDSLPSVEEIKREEDEGEKHSADAMEKRMRLLKHAASVGKTVAKLTGHKHLAEALGEAGEAAREGQHHGLRTGLGTGAGFGAQALAKSKYGDKAGQYLSDKTGENVKLGGPNASAIGGAVAGLASGRGVKGAVNTGLNWWILAIAFGAIAFTGIGVFIAFPYINLHNYWAKKRKKIFGFQFEPLNFPQKITLWCLDIACIIVIFLLFSSGVVVYCNVSLTAFVQDFCSPLRITNVWF